MANTDNTREIARQFDEYLPKDLKLTFDQKLMLLKLVKLILDETDKKIADAINMHVSAYHSDEA